jgi:SagB-type dehydrogenase family enzyme
MEKLIALPRPVSEGGPPFWEILSLRRSVRNYSSASMPLEVLSQLLWATHGVTGEPGVREARTAPSAGACYPIEAYVIVNRVSGLAPGLYRYLTGDHALMLLRKGDVGAEATAATLGQRMCRQGAALFVWTAVVPRTTGRYGERGHRYIFLDAGHIGENMYLAATAIGYGCCAIGAFDDSAMNQIVGADGKIEKVVYAAAVGATE